MTDPGVSNLSSVTLSYAALHGALGVQREYALDASQMKEDSWEVSANAAEGCGIWK